MCTCKKCNKSIPDGAVFCPWCGMKQIRDVKRGARTRPNGAGDAYKRGKTWTARVTVGFSVVDGKTVRACRTKGGFATRSDALRYCDKLRDAETAKTIPTLADYWNTFQRGKFKKLSSSKQTAYGIAFKRLKPLHARPISDITVQDLQSVVDESAKTHYTAKDVRDVLSGLYKLAAADGNARNVVPSLIEIPTLTETERTPFSEFEQAALWRAYESGVADAAIPLIMIYTGMMTGEMRRLTVEMIDFTSSKIVGVGIKTGVRKSSCVYLPDAIIPVIADASAGKTGVIFNFCENIFYAKYYASLAAAGVRKLSPYSCRHTTATALAVTENIAPQTIKKIMRWSTTKMLDRYAHPDESDAIAAINSIKRP